MTDIKTDNGLLSITVTYWPIFFYRNTEIIINSNNYGINAKLAEIPDVE